MMGAPKGNQYALGNTGGVEPFYKDVAIFNKKISDYFEQLEGNEEKPTLTGLALFIGFADKKSLYDYAKKKEFSYSIKRAILIIEKEYEMNLSKSHPTGAIFALKNMGWVDKQETSGVLYSVEVSKEEARRLSKDLENEV